MKFKTVAINGKYKIKMPEHRAARPEWYTDAGWEKARLDSMHDHLGKGDVMYYVGAELGEMPALVQMWGAELYLFEPNHRSWPVIKGVWQANKLERPLGLFAAFCGKDTELNPSSPDNDMQAQYGGQGWKLEDDKESENYDWPHYATGEIIEAHGFSNLSEEADGLPVIAIDDVVSQINLDTGAGTKPPTAMAIDVEGAEFEVLKGAVNSIETFHPKIWLSLHPEFLIQQYGVYGNDVRQWLKERGYKEELLEYQHEVHLLYTYEGGDAEQ